MDECNQSSPHYQMAELRHARQAKVVSLSPFDEQLSARRRLESWGADVNRSEAIRSHREIYLRDVDDLNSALHLEGAPAKSRKHFLETLFVLSSPYLPQIINPNIPQIRQIIIPPDELS